MRRLLVVNTLLALLLAFIFDVLAFFFLPAAYAYRFPEYRSSTPPYAGGRGRYPHGYFVAHGRRGFDIGKNKSGSHWVDGVTYPIWSNSLGCYDNEHRNYERYVYFAGDSFTWGYTPFDAKFGTVIEKHTSARILKCGVTHTGQRHQLEKLSEVVTAIGKPPRAIFVFFSPNDVGDDYAYPHSTVIRGWLVDGVYLDENDELVAQPRQELARRVEDKLRRLQEGQKGLRGWWQRTKRYVRAHSMSANMLIHAWEHLVAMMPTPETPGALRSSGEGGGSLRRFGALPQERNGRFWYQDYPKARNNRAALLDFAAYSRDRDADLVVVLIPPKEKFTDLNWYEELRRFLTGNRIRHLDLTSEFSEKALLQRELYWEHDGHLNPSGNRIVAEILIERFPELFRNGPDREGESGGQAPNVARE